MKQWLGFFAQAEKLVNALCSITFIMVCVNPALHAQYSIPQPPVSDPDSVEWLYGSFPSYEQVVTKLFGELNTEQLPSTSDYTLHKRPDGWWLVPRSFNRLHGDDLTSDSEPVEPSPDRSGDPSETSDQVLPIWMLSAIEGQMDAGANQAAAGSSAFRPKKKNTESRELLYQNWLHAENAAHYDRALFYGYPQAARQSRTLLETEVEWSPGFTEALGFACLQEARQLMGMVQRWEPGRELAEQSTTPLSIDSLEKAEVRLREATDHFRRLLSQNSADEVRTGRIAPLQMDLALMEACFLFQASGHVRRARPFAQSIRLSPFYQAYGQNLLQALPDSALLLCTNELDFLLAFHARYNLNYRNDVRVLSWPHLGLPLYRQSLQDARFGEGLQNLQRGAVDSMGLAMADEARLISHSTVNRPLFYALGYGADAIVHERRINSLMSAWKRLQGQDDESEALQLVNIGLLYRLHRQRDKPFDSKTEELLNWAAQLSDRFQFPALSRTLNEDPEAVKLSLFYRSSVGDHAHKLASSGQVEEGLRILNVIYRHLPEWVIPPDSSDLGAIEFYYQYGSAERGAEMAGALYENILSGKAHPRSRDWLSRLEELAREHGQTQRLEHYAAQRAESGY